MDHPYNLKQVAPNTNIGTRLINRGFPSKEDHLNPEGESHLIPEWEDPGASDKDWSLNSQFGSSLLADAYDSQCDNKLK